MAQDALDDILLVDERNDAHFREHFGAPQRVGLPHLLDQLAPLLARDAAPIPAWSPGAQEWPMKRQNQNSKRGSSAQRTALYQAAYKLHALPSDLRTIDWRAVMKVSMISFLRAARTI
jgi:hypothetical protein